MVHDQYRFALELERRDATPLGQFGVTMDWEPARAWARFMALRGGKRNVSQSSVPIHIEPRWDAQAGEPFVGGVRLLVAGVSVDVPVAYFHSTAERVAETLVKQKLLTAGELFNYTVLAFPNQPVSAAKPGLSFHVEEASPALSLKPARLTEFLDGATEFGTHDGTDVPVFVPQFVLDEATQMTRRAEANEIGGILIGNVCEDDERRELFVEVTALIPAKHTLSETAKLTFTAETWSAVDAAIRLRRSNEQMIGWFHSHPAKYWCSAQCSPEARRNCALSRTFFSSEDCTLQRTVFPMAHCLALLVTNTDAGLRYAMFGWRQGLIVQRGFHIMNSTAPMLEAVAAEATIGGDHEKVCD